MNVVIVDDEGVVRDVLADILRNSGIEVRTAESGRQGLDMLAETQTDFLITDFLMPAMNGAELLKEAQRVSPTTKVILISGHVDFDGKMAQATQNAYATLNKPFDFRILMDLLAPPETQA